MLGFLIVLILSFSLITAILQGSLDAVCSALLASPQKAVELAVATGCGICLWSGVMEVARQAGLLKTLSKLFSPIVSRLFPRIKKDSAAAQAVCLNLAANLLGLGAAAAPAGIRAVQEFQKSAPDQQTACDESILVILLNTASLQLIPTTAAMLRLQAGSAEPMAILPAVWVSTALSLTAGIIAAKAMACLSPLSARPHPGTCARRGCRR